MDRCHSVKDKILMNRYSLDVPCGRSVLTPRRFDPKTSVVDYDTTTSLVVEDGGFFAVSG